MTDETIVAVYDTAEHAALAVRDLEAAGVPSSAISQHSGQSMSSSSTSTTGTPPREQGFWSSLFGGEPEREHDTAVYDRSLAGGSTVVTVKTPEQYLTHTMEILERHNPIDIDERAAAYGATTTPTPTAGSVPRGTAATAATGGEKISLSEESLAVGKRAINRGTTRVRRYVVETPVEESVRLREETVSIERRPVTDSRPVTGADFTDKLVEVTETAEEAVVSKTARVKEEVVIHKDASERTETVRDTVRREEIEITKDASGQAVSGTTTTTGTTTTGTTSTTPLPKV